jgi:hypothetical protein
MQLHLPTLSRVEPDFEMLNSPEFMDRIRKGEGDIRSGRLHTTKQMRERLGL